MRFGTGSLEYRILSEWISDGAPPPGEADPRVMRSGDLAGPVVSEGRRQPADPGPRAVFERTTSKTSRAGSNGRRPMSRSAASTNKGKTQVDRARRGSDRGLVRQQARDRPGHRPVHEQPAQARADRRRSRKPRNFIDEQIDKQLARLNLTASPACTDAEFVRRAYVDTIGRLPTVDETRSFLADTSPARRDAAHRPLARPPEFTDYWTYKWSDLLMLNGTRLRPQALKTYYQWIKKQVADGVPWDQFVRAIVTSTGESVENGPTNFFALSQSPEDMTENVCQAFLGLSIGCAKCHNHPLEKWTNDQYYGMASLFARVKAKGWGGEGRDGDGRRTLYVAESGELVQPRTGKPQPPTPLDGQRARVRRSRRSPPQPSPSG